jgi:hypothetical protein
MKYALQFAAFLALSGFAPALDRPPEAEKRLSQLRRDLGLIEALVSDGLDLATQEDPLLRARTCNKLAAIVVGEIQKAAETKDKQRAAGMGQYLKTVLVRGVAGNLDRARKDLPKDSPRHAEILSIGDEVMRLIQPVTDQSALDAVNHGRDAVRKAVDAKRNR